MPHHHHHHASKAATPLCSCGDRSCEVMEIVRLLLETGDNLSLLVSEVQTRERVLSPMLEKMHTDQLSSLERWRIEQEIYRTQMMSVIRPTQRWQQFSPLEEELERRAHWVERWYHQAQEEVEQRAHQLALLIQQHEDHLAECAQRFVLQALLPACVPGLSAVLLEHLERTRARLSRVSQQADTQAGRVAEVHAHYQAEIGRIQPSQQGSDTLLAFGQREATVEWVVRNLFGLSRPQSLTLSHRTFQQLKASQQWQTHVCLQQQFFHYCEQIWRACDHVGLAAKVQTLKTLEQHWQTLWRSFQSNPDPGSIRTSLLAPAAPLP